LTNDYATLFLGPTEGFGCRCGHAGCRGEISHRQVPEALAAVRRALQGALDDVESAEQPLWPLLDPQRLQSARLAAGIGDWRFGIERPATAANSWAVLRGEA